MAFKFENLTVLVVEDVAPMKDLICSVLDTLGVGRVRSAVNGEIGFEMYQRESPDIVIADWVMEPVDGIEFTKLIRTSAMSPNRLVPVILVTGYSAAMRVGEARDAGVTEFLVKPFSANDIAKRISYVINRPRDFIDIPDYFGPDRRRQSNPNYAGPFRREGDGGKTLQNQSVAK